MEVTILWKASNPPSKLLLHFSNEKTSIVHWSSNERLLPLKHISEVPKSGAVNLLSCALGFVLFLGCHVVDQGLTQVGKLQFYTKPDFPIHSSVDLIEE